jgi:hypothetical protein
LQATNTAERAGETKMPAQDHQSETFVLYAFVGPGSHTNALYSFELGGWSVFGRFSFMIFCRQIPLAFQDVEIYQAVQDLENILLALFVNDRLPRKIFYFSYPNTLEKEISLRLLFMLGQPRGGQAADTEVEKESLFHP